MSSKSAINIVLGTATFGSSGELSSITTVPGVQALVDVFKQHSHYELDTARLYCNGSTEKLLGELTPSYGEQGLTMDTKVNSFAPGSHAYGKILESGAQSSAALKGKIRILYLHGPDRATPFEETLRALNDLHKKGVFEKLGVSNFTHEQVVEVVAICDKQGFVRPTVYQGNYNAATRNNEKDLLPLLRKEGISFYAYSPLAGGFLSGKFVDAKQREQAAGRWDASNPGLGYSGMYFKDSYFAALERVDAAAKAHGLTTTEVALRWLAHHSQLKREHGDAIIIGASKVEQLQATLPELERGELPKDVLHVIEGMWDTVKADAPAYHL